MEVYLTSPWIPAEWIQAYGLKPRGIWSAQRTAPLVLAAGMCGFAEAVSQLISRQKDAACIFGSSCDQLRRAGDPFTIRSASPSRSFLFNLPSTWQSPTSRAIYQAEIRRLGGFLEQISGNTLNINVLQEAIESRNSIRDRLRQLAGRCSCGLLARAMGQYHWDGTLLPELDQPPTPGLISLAIVGGPVTPPHWVLFDAVEKMGGNFVIDGTETGERSLLPPLPPDSLPPDPVCRLADFYFSNTIDIYQRPNVRFHQWLQSRVRERQVRGLILWHYYSCDLWRAEARHLNRSTGLPLLVIEADPARPNAPRELNRLEAFIEMLR